MGVQEKRTALIKYFDFFLSADQFMKKIFFDADVKHKRNILM